MRRCPRCLTVNSDSDLKCGVCGASLSETPSVPIKEAISETLQESKAQSFSVQASTLRSTTGIIGIASGTALIIFGIVSLPSGIPLWSLFTIFFGFILLISGVNTIASKPYRFSFGTRDGRESGGGGSHVHREADREEEERRKRDSGEAD